MLPRTASGSVYHEMSYVSGSAAAAGFGLGLPTSLPDELFGQAMWALTAPFSIFSVSAWIR